MNGRPPDWSESSLELSRRIDAAIIALAAGAVLGLILIAQGRTTDRQFTHPMHSPNDRSRFATIRALGDYNTYAIDEVIKEPGWDTIDKIRRPDTGRIYSSKPPLLPTLLAYEYRFIKLITAGWLNFRDHPHALVRIIVATANLVPLVGFLLLYSRLLDRIAPDPWARAFCMVTASTGTYLTGFSVTLNNHTVAAFCSFFALYAALLVWCDGLKQKWLFVSAGLFAGLAAVTELPALAFLAVLCVGLLFRAPRETLLLFVPVALIPLAGHFSTNYLVTGDLSPAYDKKDWYEFEGSYWKIDPETGRLVGSQRDPATGELKIGDPSGIDNQFEPWWLYLFHMVLGHHGILSLSPVLLLAFIGLARRIAGGVSELLAPALLVFGLTSLLLFFYTAAPALGMGQRNYGGMCNGLRWLFWLIPLWLVFLPDGIKGWASSRWLRGLALFTLAISAASAFYATRNPWTRPWLQELLHSAGWIGY
jgi:hypothetical protein